MSQITYYNSSKTYTPLKIGTPDTTSELKLLRFEKKLSFVISEDDAKDIRNPMLLICGKQALARINRYTFFNVEITDDLWPLLSHCDNIEMLVTPDNSSCETVYMQIQRVLHFPDTLKLETWKHDTNSTAKDDDDDDDDDDWL